jgi:SAM-dependent methyltransferase
MVHTAEFPYYDGLNAKLLAAIPKDAWEVLELGCANGRLGEACKRLNPSVRWTGVDINASALADACHRLDEAIQMNLDSPDASRLKGGYDVVVCGDVLEHLQDPMVLLRFAREVTSRDARLVCCIPNMTHGSVIERMLAGDLSYDDAGLLDRTHLRFLSPASSYKLLLDAGWLPHLSDSYTVGHQSQNFLQRLVFAAQEIGIPPRTAARNLLGYQFIVDCIKAPVVPAAPTATRFSVVVPVNNALQFELNVRRSPGIAEIGAEVIPVEGASSAAEAFTLGRQRASHKWIVFCHQDVYFPRESGRALTALFDSVPDSEASRTLIGFAGISRTSNAQTAPSGLVIDRMSRFDFPESANAVSLDELAIAVTTDTIHEIDPRFGWHIWATDLCLAAIHHRHASARIVRIPVFHNSYNDGTLPASFHAAMRALHDKYPAITVIPTLNGNFAARA